MLPVLEVLEIALYVPGVGDLIYLPARAEWTALEHRLLYCAGFQQLRVIFATTRPCRPALERRMRNALPRLSALGKLDVVMTFFVR